MGLNALRNSSSRIIGVTIHTMKYYTDTILSDPFYSHVVGVLEREIRKAGYYMMLYAAENIDDIFVMATTWNIDGLIAITFTQKDYNKLRSLVDKPIVAIDLIDQKQGTPYFNVGLDDENGGYIMTKYLIEQGFRDILIFANKDFGVDHLRYLGYRRAFQEYAIPYKKEYFVLLGETVERRIETYAQLMKFIKKRYAMFFLADLYALEAINYFLTRNVSVPMDVSIAGYDDAFHTNITTQKLTTVHQDVTQKAVCAMEMLLRLIRGETLGSNNILLPVTLKIRNTVRYPHPFVGD